MVMTSILRKHLGQEIEEAFGVQGLVQKLLQLACL